MHGPLRAVWGVEAVSSRRKLLTKLRMEIKLFNFLHIYLRKVLNLAAQNWFLRTVETLTDSFCSSQTIVVPGCLLQRLGPKRRCDEMTVDSTSSKRAHSIRTSSTGIFDVVAEETQLQVLWKIQRTRRLLRVLDCTAVSCLMHVSFVRSQAS